MQSIKRMKKIPVFLIFLFACFLFPAAASAAVIYVNSSTGNDSTGNGSSGNPYQTFHKGYTMASASDTLNLTGTFTWTDAAETGDATTTGYTLGKNLTIQGQSATTTIIQADSTQGVADRRVFTLSSGTSVTFSDITIRYGNVAADGGGVSAGSGTNNTVVFRNCILEKNNATLGSGGGYYSRDTTNLSFTMDNCLVRDNTSNHTSSNVFGGGMHLSSGQSTITNSTFTGNRSKTGGAVYFYYSSVTLTNSTLTGNTATSGPAAFYGYYGSGSQIITNTTIAYNNTLNSSFAGGVEFGLDVGTLYLKNSIIAQNTNPSGPLDWNNPYGTPVSSSNNIVETQNGNNFVNGVNGNIVGAQANLNLSNTLADNSTTKMTQTLALSAGSVAINAGTFTANSTISIPWTDQRGLYKNGAADIGAYEYNGQATLFAPSVQATNVGFSSVAQQSMTASWTNGDGGMRVVFVAATTTASTATPVDATTYTANAAFGSGTQIGSSGWYAVYKGTGTSVSMSGLAPGTDYRAHVVEYNGASGEEKYLATSATGNPAATTTTAYITPTTAATNLVIGSISGKSAAISWTNGNGSTRAVFMKQASSGSSAPTDGITYTANAAFGSGTQIGSSGWYAVYKGTGTSVSVSNITHGNDYQVHVVEFNGATGYEKYLIDSAGNNPNTKNAYAGTTIYSNYSSGNDTTGNGSSGSPYKTFHKAYTVAIDGDTLNLTGTFTWSNADETGDTASNGYIIGKSVTITGQNATSTIIQPVTTDNTADRRVFTISTSQTITIQNLALRYGKASNGGCLYVNTTNVSLTLQQLDIFSCRSTGSTGGGIYSSASSLTVENSSFRSNVSATYGGGAYVAGAQNIFTNVTFTGNTATSTNASGSALGASGSGVNAYLTNSTVANNTAYYGALFVSSAAMYLKNTLVANNISTNTANRANFDRSSGSFTSSGYNIFGIYNTTYFNPLTADDWRDQSGSGTYTLYNTSTTGTLSLDSAANVNSADNGTYTHALQVGSIGINHGTSTAHSSIAIPSTDQRGLGRSGATDIGAYEYGGFNDTTAPTVSLTAPNSGDTVSGSSITLSATSSDDVAVAGVKFYVNGILTGSEDTSSPYSIIWDSTTASSSVKTLVAVARDAANNYATSTSISVTVANEPTPSSVAASAGSNGATITWTTPFAGSSRAWFGLSSTYSTSTAEVDISPRVTSHSVTIAGLPSCALFHYAVTSRNAALDSATSTDATFRTSGCTGSAAISASNEGSITVASGGSLTQGALVLTAPTSFTATSSAATFQAHQLGASAFFATAGAPSGKTRAGDSVFNIKALIDATTTLSTFIQPITVALTYTASDISGLTESSLWIYRYDGSSWYALNGCSVNTSAKTVTCATTSFSDFSLFGDVAQSSPPASSTASGGGLFIAMQPRALSPASALDFVINNGDAVTNSPLVTLTLNSDPAYVRGYAVSLDPYFTHDSIYNFATTASFLLPDKSGTYALYLKYYSKTGHSSSVVSHSIEYQKTPASNAPDIVAPSKKMDEWIFLFTKNLRRGNEGLDVRRLQEFLNNNGFALASDGPGSKGNETIHFGPRTQEALIKFQKAHSISPAAGYFGPITRGVIERNGR